MKKPAKKRNRRNGDETAEAAALSEAFHGRPAQHVREIAELVDEPTTLADLGRLVQLTIYLPGGDRSVTLRFSGNVRVAARPDGTSIYFVGGDQKIDLARLGLEPDVPKDHVLVGEVAQIVYHTSKAFHSFEPTDYEHDFGFGEENAELPQLASDVRSNKLYLLGGSYQVRPEGIVN